MTFEEKLKAAQAAPVAAATAATDTPAPDMLAGLLELHYTVKATMKTEIVASKPVLVVHSPVTDEDGTGYLYPCTINTIQGQTGTHKSRLSAIVCAALLNPGRAYLDGVFIPVKEAPKTLLVYVDTERNIAEQLPVAMRGILERAGYDPRNGRDCDNFVYTSLFEVPRQARSEAVRQFLRHFRETYPATEWQMFVVLDVLTDCVEDFNNARQSVSFLDDLNRMANREQCSFLCVLHENPGGEKARGHLGTELQNKSSTVISINFEKDKRGEDTDLLRVKFRKTRGSKRPAPVYLTFSQKEMDLVLADEMEVKTTVGEREKEGGIEDVIERIAELVPLAPGHITQAKLVEKLCESMGIGRSKAAEKIKEVREKKLTVYGPQFEQCTLTEGKQGKSMILSLQPVPEAAEPATPAGDADQPDLFTP